MREARGRVFGAVADEYDRVRRGYPQELVDEACARAGLRPGSRVVEVGCGTGKLTVALAARGLDVDAVEPDGAMAAVARRRVGDAAVRFHAATFEEVELPERAFAALFSATAFHWVDPSVSWAKARRLLLPGGVLAQLVHVGGGSEVDDAFLAAWREFAPELPRRRVRAPDELWRVAGERRGNVSEVWSWLVQHDLARPEAAWLFDDVRISSVPIEVEDTADSTIALVRTTSSYLRLDAGRQGELERRLRSVIDEAGGRYRSTILAVLVTAAAV